MDGPLIECVPNVSEGRNKQLLGRLSDLISRQAGVKLLHVDMGYDANRTVFTYAGAPEPVLAASFELYAFCKTHIDMRFHKGSHSRIGAVDVCPFVPVNGIDMEEVIRLANDFGKRIGKELGIPVYLYEQSAKTEERQNLANIRRGEFELLAQKMKDPSWYPDFGPGMPSSKFGATAIGARSFLIAYNINLRSDAPLEVAKKMAGILRESGTSKHPGLFKGLKAIGWHQPQFGCCQLSTNIVDPDNVNMGRLFQSATRLAHAMGYDTDGSELIGLIPKRYLAAAGQCMAAGENQSLEIVINKLGLATLNEFDLNKRILELALESDLI
ncbi:MAG: glutamate formimidoyltransferase [Bacteroidota bacterium]